MQETAHRPQRWEDALVYPTQQLNHPYTGLQSNHPEITSKWATSILPFHKTNPRASDQASHSRCGRQRSRHPHGGSVQRSISPRVDEDA